MFLETGAGKTYISVMAIKFLFGEKEEIRELSLQQIKDKRDKRM